MIVTLFQVWLAREDHELGSCAGRGLGVQPCIFFDDSVRAASAMEGWVQVRSGRSQCVM